MFGFSVLDATVRFEEFANRLPTRADSKDRSMFGLLKHHNVSGDDDDDNDDDVDDDV